MSAKKRDRQRQKSAPWPSDSDPGLTRVEIEAIDAELRKHPDLMPTTEDMERVMRWTATTKAHLERSPQKVSRRSSV